MWGERISKVEYRLLCQAVAEACELAGRGDPVAGYHCLTTGFERAAEFAASGEPWAQELAQSYLVALEEFASLRQPQPVLDASPSASHPGFGNSAQPRGESSQLSQSG